MKIVFLDRKTIGEDVSYEKFYDLGEVVIYDYSTPEQIPERIKDADIIVLNKMPINEKTVGQAKNLKLVCVTATGTNNLDKEYLKKAKIEWRNVAGYSTEAVTQHTFALLFYLLEHLNYYDKYVKEEKYVNDEMFTHFEKHFHELSGKTWGIIGLGNIGKRVAEVASCFGAKVIYYSTSGKNHDNKYEETDFEGLLKNSDIISIHAPLDENTQGLIDKEALKKMKKSAILINVGRGPIVVEADLADALEEGEIAAAGLDVLSEEPMREKNPLRRIKDSDKLFITPHIAWAGKETRQRLMDIIAMQISEFI
ncbi:MAG: D-2-hydroxyacid dehydrogenase [Eubacterium sp.]|nr:D-2-hydroxyacid dehydrogenase [Eubacterium sp.]